MPRYSSRPRAAAEVEAAHEEVAVGVEREEVAQVLEVLGARRGHASSCQRGRPAPTGRDAAGAGTVACGPLRRRVR